MNIQTKQDLRERILTLLRSQEEEERLTKSLLIKDKLFQMGEIREAKTILFYASFDGEVDTFEMINQAHQSGKTVALPRVESQEREIIPIVWEKGENLDTGPYGIKQPPNKESQKLQKDELDAIIVPGVAFDKDNNRLGRGAGYYDRFLADTPKDIPTIGLAFDFQCVDSIPQIADHDAPLTHVVTN